ncbi:hypothetical protein NQZ68_000507 [Dissostichus eleginoides]|nr:hypothetical protein NQZ68_000507 [Dissostichus eleginoides]
MQQVARVHECIIQLSGPRKMLPAVIVVLMLISFTCGENPAIQVILTSKGLQYGKHIGTGWVQEKLEHITLPDFSGKIFGIHYILTGITITKCDFPEPIVEFNPDNTGFTTSISGLSVALTGGWMTHFGLIYREKITAHIGYDPYQLKKSDFSRDLSDLPAVEEMDITSYLVLHTSYYTASQMKPYKSLEAFNYLVCGWVNDLGTKEALNKCRLVFARLYGRQPSALGKTSCFSLGRIDWNNRKLHNTPAFSQCHDGGSFNMAIFDLDVTSVVKLGKDPDGHLSVTSISCDAQVGDVDIHFEGGASWMFQPFVEHFKGRIRGEIMSKICPNVEESIVSLEYHLQAMEVSIQVDEDLVLDIPLTGVPVIDASSMILSLKGEFYDRKTHEPPFEAQNFTVPEQPDYMLSMGLSEFTVNSASYALYSGGRLQVLITDSMIPPYIHVRLNTSSMGPYVPQLPKMFPGLLMNLQVYASEVPMLSFQPGVVKLDLAGAVKASAIEPNSTQIPLFKLNVDLKFDGKVWVAAGRLKGSMALQSLTLTLAGSEVGHFETDALESLVKIGVMAGLAKLNVELGKGVDLPRMRNAQLVNTVLGVEEGFIAMCSDAEVFTDSFN